MRIGAVGAYPDDPYYDPERPSLLPYWIDDTTESLAKYNAQNLLQATANAAGDATGTIVGAAASGLTSATTSAFGSMDLSTILLLAGIGFIAFSVIKK